jgi:hypothetical protein
MINGVTESSSLAIVDRFVDLLLAPAQFTQMLWMAVPLVLTIFLMELYFSRYSAEELGWNSAYGNALVLLFVTVDLFRYLYNNNLLEMMSLKLALALAVAILAILLTMINFLHILPEGFAYGLSSKLPMNFIAYTALILIYSEIPIDITTLISSAGLFILFAAIILVIRSIIPKSVEGVSY